MEIHDALMLMLVAFIAGAQNSLAGGGTFLTFPILVMAGMPPIAANATSCVALWPGSLAGVAGYRRDFTEHRGYLGPLLTVSLIGGLAGAILLLLTPETTFSALIPYLLLSATLIFAFGRYAVAYLRRNIAEEAPGGAGAGGILLQLAIAVYGGYFGAGIGILMLAMLELTGMKSIHEMNALKTLLASAVNSIAVAVFLIAGAVWWPHASVMAVAAILGGFLGAHYGRKLPSALIRGMVIATGLAMTLYFFLHD